jgi:hypothetical protein
VKAGVARMGSYRRHGAHDFIGLRSVPRCIYCWREAKGDERPRQCCTRKSCAVKHRVRLEGLRRAR